MKKVKLSDWVEMMKELELSVVKDDDFIFKEGKKEEYIKLCNEFWKLEVEDKEIELEDLKKDEGYLYVKMVNWNENELMKELGLNMVWWEYSLEDFFRDSFGIKKEESKYDKNDEYNMFEIKEINKMMYGKDYEEEEEEEEEDY
jgi:cell division protein FtsB